MQSSITFDDVLASATKFGCVLVPDYEKVRDLKKLNPKSALDTTYIPILFRHINGKNMKVKINFSEQMIASGAKITQGGDEEEDDDEQENEQEPHDSDDDNEDSQDISLANSNLSNSIVVSDNIDRYMENNIKFQKVLDIIDTSYKTICDELKENYLSIVKMN